MKVTQMIDSMVMGGAETLVRNYAIEMKNQGIDIEVICYSYRKNTPNERALDESGIKSIYLADKFLMWGKKKINNSVICKLLQLLLTVPCFIISQKKQNPDIVHMHMHTIGLHPFIPKRIKKTAYFFYTIHTELSMEFPDTIYGRWAKKYIKGHPEISIITLNEKMKQEAKCMFSDNKVFQINNGINLKRFRNILVDKETMKDQLGIPQDRYVIGHVGRFVDVKNQEFIIEIGKILNERGYNIHVLLVGDGPTLEKNNTLIKKYGLENRITILKERSDIPEIMNCMDVFVFPSKYEGFGNVMIEAQALNLRCICSDVVPTNTRVTKRTIALSLKEGAERWGDIIIDENIEYNEQESTIEQYDISYVIKELNKLYMNNYL